MSSWTPCSSMSRERNGPAPGGAVFSNAARLSPALGLDEVGNDGQLRKLTGVGLVRRPQRQKEDDPQAQAEDSKRHQAEDQVDDRQGHIQDQGLDGAELDEGPGLLALRYEHHDRNDPPHEWQVAQGAPQPIITCRFRTAHRRHGILSLLEYLVARWTDCTRPRPDRKSTLGNPETRPALLRCRRRVLGWASCELPFLARRPSPFHACEPFPNGFPSSGWSRSRTDRPAEAVASRHHQSS